MINRLPVSKMDAMVNVKEFFKEPESLSFLELITNGTFLQLIFIVISPLLILILLIILITIIKKKRRV